MSKRTGASPDEDRPERGIELTARLRVFLSFADNVVVKNAASFKR